MSDKSPRKPPFIQQPSPVRVRRLQRNALANVGHCIQPSVGSTPASSPSSSPSAPSREARRDVKPASQDRALQDAQHFSRANGHVNVREPWKQAKVASSVPNERRPDDGKPPRPFKGENPVRHVGPVPNERRPEDGKPPRPFKEETPVRHVGPVPNERRPEDGKPPRPFKEESPVRRAGHVPNERRPEDGKPPRPLREENPVRHVGHVPNERRPDDGKPPRPFKEENPIRHMGPVPNERRPDDVKPPRPFKEENPIRHAGPPKGRPRDDVSRDASLYKTINTSAFYAGEQVLVKRAGGKVPGVVLAVLDHKNPLLYGIELRHPDGGGCGKRGNVRYFKCRDQCGIFVSEESVEKLPTVSTQPPKAPFSLTAFGDYGSYPGLDGPKKHLTSLWKMAKVAEYKGCVLQHATPAPLRTFVFAGPRGCGKTVIAAHLGHILRDSGCISKGSVRTLTTWDSDEVDKVWDASEGCVLMVTDNDEEDSRSSHVAQKIAKRWRAMTAIFDEKQHWPQFLVLVLSVPHETPPARWKFLHAGGQCATFQFSPYGDRELVDILRLMVAKMDFTLDPKLTNDQLLTWIRNAQRSGAADCPNAHGCARLIAEALRRQSARIYPLLKGAIPSKVVRMLTRDDFESDAEAPQGSLQTYLDQLNAFTGLQEVKDVVTTMIHRARWNVQRRVQGARDDKVDVGSAVSRHMMFVGSPGTGKTTVARLLGDIFREIGELRVGHMIDTDRSGLVAPYVGQTAPLTKATVQKALGGILFIDEAYSLNMSDGGKKDTFGEEAVVQLLKMMEDHRDDLIVIIAGYTAGIEKLLETNPGLKERFIQKVHFADFGVKELQEIGERMIRQEGLTLSTDGRVQFNTLLAELVAKRDASFSNARLVRNVVQKASDRLATRVGKGLESGRQVDLNELVRSDFIGLKF